MQCRLSLATLGGLRMFLPMPQDVSDVIRWPSSVRACCAAAMFWVDRVVPVSEDCCSRFRFGPKPGAPLTSNILTTWLPVEPGSGVDSRPLR